jgi:hypothetical protein
LLIPKGVLGIEKGEGKLIGGIGKTIFGGFKGMFFPRNWLDRG